MAVVGRTVVLVVAPAGGSSGSSLGSSKEGSSRHSSAVKVVSASALADTLSPETAVDRSLTDTETSSAQTL